MWKDMLIRRERHHDSIFRWLSVHYLNSGDIIAVLEL